MTVVHSAGTPTRSAERLDWFVADQIRQIREGGLPVLLRKVSSFLMMAPAAVVLLLVYIARPLVLIRFGVLVGSRFGRFAGCTALYLSHRDAGIPARRTLDFFFYDGPASNQQLKKMCDRTLRVSHWAKWPWILAGELPGFSVHVVPIYADTDRDVLGVQARTPAHLSFTAEEEDLGQAALRELGIPEGASFICFLARDSAHTDLHSPSPDGVVNCRDSSIHSHVPAAEALTRRGYFALRMGAMVKEPLDTTNPMIVDYSTKHRTDFLDIYLGAKCQFYIGDPDGYMFVPVLFRRPSVHVNIIPLDRLHSWNPNYLLIPKKLWLRNEHRLMTFGEHLDSTGQTAGRTEDYERLGIEVIDNTPEEIAAVAVEMDERLNGTWQTTEEDEELQRRFWSGFENKCGVVDRHGVLLSRIGAEFLRQNRDLLD